MTNSDPIDDISIGGEMIRLGQFLKFAGLIDSGGDAKEAIIDGFVSVNGAETVSLPALGNDGTTFTNGRQTLYIKQGLVSWAGPRLGRYFRKLLSNGTDTSSSPIGLPPLPSSWLLLSRLTSTATRPSQRKSGETFPSGSKTTFLNPHSLRKFSARRSESSISVPSIAFDHDICDKLEQAIKAECNDAQISIHVEPDDKAKHSGIVVL